MIRYSYVAGPSGQPSLNNTELYIKTGRAIGPLTVGAAYYYTPDGPSASGVNGYVVGSTSVKIAKRWIVSGLFGHQHVHAGGSYSDFNAGVTYALTKSLNLDARYVRTNRSLLGSDYRPRAVASLQLAL